MDLFSIIGYVAAVLTTVSFLPQALQIIKTKNTKGISLPMYLLFTTGVFLWLIYGLHTRSVPVWSANLVTFILAAIILTFKIKYK